MDLRGLKDKDEAKKVAEEILEEKAIDIPFNLVEDMDGRNNRKSDNNEE
jgi:hypothetical protein